MAPFAASELPDCVVEPSLSQLPAIEPGIAMTVTIPARDEEAEIERALRALAAQRDAPPFEVVLLANNCTDATVERAIRFARSSPKLRIHVVAVTVPPDVANVGTARKMLMDAAASRFCAAGLKRGIVATTDADTTVAPDWVARTFEEMEPVDAVAGCVEIRESDRLAMSRSLRALYARELRYRHAIAELEAAIDPIPEDPLPRHSSFVGASFAVTAEAYERAGGLPALSALEDREFLSSLRRIDARVRHSLRVRAWTSGRTLSRVSGGFATFINHLLHQAPERASYDVADPHEMICRLESRAALRHIWSGYGTAADAAAVQALTSLESSEYRHLIDASSTFGQFHERVIALAPALVARPLVPVEDALEAIALHADARRNVPVG